MKTTLILATSALLVLTVGWVLFFTGAEMPGVIVSGVGALVGMLAAVVGMSQNGV